MGLTTLSISTAQFLQPLARFNPSLLPTNTPTVVLPPPSLSLSYSDCPPTHSSQSQSQSQSLGWLARPSSPRIITRASATNVPENIGEILGDVSIFRASGEPVMFKDLWDQNEVRFLNQIPQLLLIEFRNCKWSERLNFFGRPWEGG